MTTKNYTFDFSKGFTITDYATYQRWQKSNNDIDITMQFYEVVDSFFVGDLFALDMSEVTEVLMQFAAAFVQHLDTK